MAEKIKKEKEKKEKNSNNNGKEKYILPGRTWGKKMPKVNIEHYTTQNKYL